MSLRRRFVLSSAIAALAASPALAAAHTEAFSLHSTLDRKTVLPHRIHWYAYPSIASSKIAEVHFLIDGRLSWVEHHAPYSYGFNANYLVTTWLTPGRHHFKVVALARDGRRAYGRLVTARVLPAASPPAELVGTWTRTMAANQTHGQPSGTWILTINKIGWRIKVPAPGPGANLIDVGYVAPGLLESRGGIWTKPHPKDNPTEGNGWCDEPFQPVRYRWSVSGDELTLKLVGRKRCDGERVIWAGIWTRKT